MVVVGISSIISYGSHGFGPDLELDNIVKVVQSRSFGPDLVLDNIVKLSFHMVMAQTWSLTIL